MQGLVSAYFEALEGAFGRVTWLARRDALCKPSEALGLDSPKGLVYITIPKRYVGDGFQLPRACRRHQAKQYDDFEHEPARPSWTTMLEQRLYADQTSTDPMPSVSKKLKPRALRASGQAATLTNYRNKPWSPHELTQKPGLAHPNGLFLNPRRRANSASAC